jgi:hypothetical protein
MELKSKLVIEYFKTELAHIKAGSYISGRFSGLILRVTRRRWRYSVSGGHDQTDVCLGTGAKICDTGMRNNQSKQKNQSQRHRIRKY